MAASVEDPEADSIGQVTSRFFTFGSASQPMRLRCGDTLGPVTLAYETYGELSPAADNAILLFHALTGSQHAAGDNPAVEGVGKRWNDECRTGWWHDFIGPGKALDTRCYFVVCANYLGGCYGSSGPASTDPTTGRPYGRSFPRTALADTVDAQVRLLDHLGIDKLKAVIGNSTGGLASLSLATRYPERVANVVPAASGLGTTPLHRVLNFEQIVAIQNDPAFRGGEYELDEQPRAGLSLARMISHKAFVSLAAMDERSRDDILATLAGDPWYQVEHPLESYMVHQGDKLPERFDANSYLRILDAWQTFDLLRDAGADSLDELLGRCRGQRFLVFSIDSDLCFFPREQALLVAALRRAGVEARHITVHSDKGHDSFLVEPELFAPQLDHFLREG